MFGLVKSINPTTATIQELYDLLPPSKVSVSLVSVNTSYTRVLLFLLSIVVTPIMSECLLVDILALL